MAQLARVAVALGSQWRTEVTNGVESGWKVIRVMPPVTDDDEWAADDWRLELRSAPFALRRPQPRNEPIKMSEKWTARLHAVDRRIICHTAFLLSAQPRQVAVLRYHINFCSVVNFRLNPLMHKIAKMTSKFKKNWLGQYGTEPHYSTLPFGQFCALKG